ncbi:MAG TPA: hypothetical protein VGL59_20830, partial [Polyangia bacterium]
AMLTPQQFPLRWRAIVWAATTAVTLTLALAPAARATEPLLQGPYPFAHNNELSAHVLLAGGLGDSFGGTKLAADYGYHLGGAAWLNLDVNTQFGGCRTDTSPCSSGKVFETLAGAKWKFATSTPIVVHAKATGGLVYVFPDDGHAALGVAARGGGGATYFFYDWIGLGLEACLSLGHVSYESTYNHSDTYAVFDFGGGVEVEF